MVSVALSSIFSSDSMPTVQLRFDMRASEFGASHKDLYAAAVDMAEYADRAGLAGILFSGHHGCADGYLSSSIDDK